MIRGAPDSAGRRRDASSTAPSRPVPDCPRGYRRGVTGPGSPPLRRHHTTCGAYLVDVALRQHGAHPGGHGAPLVIVAEERPRFARCRCAAAYPIQFGVDRVRQIATRRVLTGDSPSGPIECRSNLQTVPRLVRLRGGRRRPAPGQGGATSPDISGRTCRPVRNRRTGARGLPSGSRRTRRVAVGSHRARTRPVPGIGDSEGAAWGAPVKCSVWIRLCWTSRVQ